MESNEIFAKMVAAGASDMFLKVGMPPGLRVAGHVEYMKDVGDVTPEFTKKLYEVLADARVRKIYDEHGEADTAYDLPSVGRFRVNLYRQRGHMGYVFRHVKSVIPSMDDLHLPTAIMKKIAQQQRGLVLVTGIAGSGKSTCLGAMLNFVNATLPKHVVTVEDPIEYIFKDDKCLIDQRELGIDTHTFAAALKHVVRQSPDIIMIGEMRDVETMDAAMNAAETGHLVFSTLHTVNAYQTVERIMAMYPPHQHEFIRQQMSLLLRGVISLRLIRNREGSGRVPAVEILIDTPTVKELLLAGKFREIGKALKEGSYYGTQTFNQSLKGLITDGFISVEEALGASDNPDELKLELRGIQKGSKAADFDFKNF